MNLEVLATGVNETGKRVDLIGVRALNPQRAFQDILQQLLSKEKRLFETGRGWPPDKRSTLARKAREGLDPRPLHATGRLERFLATREGQPLKLDRTELVIGVPAGRHDLHYARYQKKHGRDPLISRRTVSSTAKQILADFLAGR